MYYKGKPTGKLRGYLDTKCHFFVYFGFIHGRVAHHSSASQRRYFSYKNCQSRGANGFTYFKALK